MTTGDLEDAPARWTRFFADYLRVDTTNPPGNEARAAPLLTGALAALGLTPEVREIVPGRANVWAVLAAEAKDPGARPLILLHHIDVVPVERERWTVDPFGGVERDGRLYGRGAVDTKVLGALHLLALERLVAQRARLRRDVIFLAVADEEHGGAGARAIVEAQLGTWAPEYLLDEGGFAVRSFMNDRDLMVIATGQKRVAKLKLTVHGEAGHGSRPIPGGGPELLVTALARLQAEPPPMRLTPTAEATFARFGALAGFPKGPLLARLHWPGMLWALGGTLAANKNLNPMLRDTVTLTKIHMGQKENVIPAEASALFDVRLLPDTDAAAFLARLKGLLEGIPATLELVEPPLPPSAPSPTEDPLYEALVDAARAHAPTAVVAPWLLIGANDSRFFAPHGVKTYGFMPVFLEKAQLDSIHGHDENISLAELETGFAIYAEALERFLVRPQ